jgi:hypothetical protein
MPNAWSLEGQPLVVKCASGHPLRCSDVVQVFANTSVFPTGQWVAACERTRDFPRHPAARK